MHESGFYASKVDSGQFAMSVNAGRTVKSCARTTLQVVRCLHKIERVASAIILNSGILHDLLAVIPAHSFLTPKSYNNVTTS